eukprot:1841486-Rhodomonas_salina.2
MQAHLSSNTIVGCVCGIHAGDPDTRRSVTGYVTMLCGGAISWASNCQAVVALSSSEAEFYAASAQAAGCDVAYFRMILDQLGLRPQIPRADSHVTSVVLCR